MISFKRIRKRRGFKFSYLIVYVISGLLGFLGSGGTLLGLAGGLCSGLLCSLLSFLGCIPFIGIPIYWLTASNLNHSLSHLVPGIGLACGFSFWLYLIIALFMNLIISAICALLLLKKKATK